MILTFVKYFYISLKKSHQGIYIYILSLLFLSNLSVQSQIDTLRINSIEILRNDIKSLISNSDFANANIGLCVQAVESGEYIFVSNESKNFIPASTQKIITTAAALDYLGADFKFSTKLYLDGKLNGNGEFMGNVIIRGLGDPSLSKYYHKEPLEIFDVWIKKLDSLGINSITGNIIGDDSYFDDVYYGPGWSWDDFSYFYSSQVSALSFNDNRVDLYIYSGDSVGDAARINSYPQSNYYRINNRIKTSHPTLSNSLNGSRDFNSNIIKLWGSVPYEQSRKTPNTLSLTIENPTLYFLNIFKSKLEQEKISFSGGLMKKSDVHENIDYLHSLLLAENFSPPLKEIIDVINQESHNLAAEMILKTLGKENFGNGTFYSGSEYLQKFLLKAGVNVQNVKIFDGSGLSRLNLISPRNLVNVLNYVYRSSNKDIFIKSLAKPGEPGTLKRRMNRSKAEKNVVGKTGSMNNVSAICGYVTTSDNETFAFAIMMQNFTVPTSLASNLQDLILMRLSSFSRDK